MSLDKKKHRGATGGKRSHRRGRRGVIEGKDVVSMLGIGDEEKYRSHFLLVLMWPT